MSKQLLIDEVEKSPDIASKAAAERAIDVVIDSIEALVRQGETVTLRGFGVFAPKQRAARQGRNVRTGEPIAIAEKTVMTFKPKVKL